ncbi:LuxR C-terminal-related transcriptional regulator [Enterobacter quasiroggenkampii]|uniref:helix-turn-helix transcriptional regulator n=1 Tax=Enterobacter quasiroggenkampii TaxID=2497436 RepID=UPI0021D20A1D|nr:LuxR C-terminal-related transcriptional regulator [Enterobacter quasiroggenkampii]MCU6396992.1 LuxR C-terminal-related transcriptional regulator [Enterobacter quasiroggenkampii]
MRHKIFTKNNYIKVAFIHLLREIHPKTDACIVDIGSYTSLSELLDEIESDHLRYNRNIYILKGTNIHSKVLEPFSTFGIDDRLDNIKQLLITENPINWPDLKQHLIMTLELSMMSEKEKQIAWALSQHTDVSTIAKIENVNYKTIYSYIAIIARKLNLRHLNEVRAFITSEINNK